MLIATQTPYELLRERQCRHARALLGGYIDRLTWAPDRLRAERVRKLRSLVAIAKERSLWHRRRLAGLDPNALGERDLERIPPMTKDDLMANFDAIVTDPRLSLDLIERHLAGLTDDAYLFDEHHAVASGGSSGRRGVFVYGWHTWCVAHVGFVRHLVRERGRSRPGERAPVAAVVASASLAHFSAAHARTFSDPRLIEYVRLPVTVPEFPLERLVAGLNALQPTILSGYPSALEQLARATRAGTLQIAPELVVSYSEQLGDAVRAELEGAWGVGVRNGWGSSEGGPTGLECAAGSLHLSDDLLVYEPVDAGQRPVPAGQSADQLLLTNLYNPVLPLIRYELTDRITVSETPCACGSTHRCLSALEGRRDDSFRYPGGVVVSPRVFYRRLGGCRGVVEYQVRQRSGGVTIDVRTAGTLDLAGLEAEVAADLHALGLVRPRVRVRAVEHLDRQASGKLRRFIPLSSVDASPSAGAGGAPVPEVLETVTENA